MKFCGNFSEQHLPLRVYRMKLGFIEKGAPGYKAQKIRGIKYSLYVFEAIKMLLNLFLICLYRNLLRTEESYFVF